MKYAGLIGNRNASKVPVERIPEMVAAYNRGELLKVMADEFGINTTAISTACQRAGCKPRYKKRYGN